MVEYESFIMKVALQELLAPSTEIATVITNCLANFQKEDGRFPLDTVFHEQMKTYTTSGKFFRGCCMLATQKAFSGSYSQAHVQVAAALELICSGLLVHDDIMDQDTRRRGQPTIHTAVSTWATQNNFTETAHFGESIALCFGDILFFLGFRLLNQADIPATQKIKLLEIATRELAMLGLAQSEDMRMASIPIDEISKSEVLAMQYGKTGRYTGRWPLLTVGILNDCDADILEKLGEIGDEIGLLYQWRDDYLGLVGDPSKTGKNTLSDVREGKKTLYYWHALHTKAAQTQVIQSTFGNAQATPQEVSQLVAVLKDSGVITQVEQETAAHQKTVMQMITQAKLPKKVQQIFKQVVELIVARDK